MIEPIEHFCGGRIHLFDQQPLKGAINHFASIFLKTNNLIFFLQAGLFVNPYANFTGRVDKIFTAKMDWFGKVTANSHVQAIVTVFASHILMADGLADL